MKIGELALLHIHHTLAYGKEGSFSFPNVPPEADVIYEVELIGYEEPREVPFNRAINSAAGDSLEFFPREKPFVNRGIFGQLISFVFPNAGKASR